MNSNTKTHKRLSIIAIRICSCSAKTNWCYIAFALRLSCLPCRRLCERQCAVRLRYKADLRETSQHFNIKYLLYCSLVRSFSARYCAAQTNFSLFFKFTSLKQLNSCCYSKYKHNDEMFHILRFGKSKNSFRLPKHNFKASIRIDFRDITKIMIA